jgi:hypothetical protein
MCDDKVFRERDSKTVAEIAVFLHEYYRGFELADLKRMGDGLCDDFAGLFRIPSRSADLLLYDKKSILEGSAQAFEAYAGRNPMMKVTHLNVWPRPNSNEEAMASYELDLYLDGALVGVALVVADLRNEDGEWRLSRLYENKRR